MEFIGKDRMNGKSIKTKEEFFLGFKINQNTKFLTLVIICGLIQGIIFSNIFPITQAPDEHFHFVTIQKIAEKYQPNHGQEYFGVSVNPNKLESIVYLLFAKSSVQIRFFILRLISIFLSLAVIVVSYFISKEIFGENHFMNYLTPVFLLFQPMFVHIGSMINPDNLANLFYAVFILFSIRIIKGKFNWLTFFGLILVILLGIFTKQTTFISLLVVLFVPVLFLINKVGKKWTSLYILVVFLGILLITLPLLFDFLPKFTEREINFIQFQNRLKIQNLINAFFFHYQPTSRAFMSFWARFGPVKIKINDVLYQLLYILLNFSLAGFIVYMIKQLSEKGKANFQRFVLLMFLLINIIASVYAVILSTEVYPQGRWIFPVITGVAVVIMVGFAYLFFFRQKKVLLVLYSIISFLFVNISLIKYIIPEYYYSLSDLVNIKPDTILDGYRRLLTYFLPYIEKVGIFSNNLFYYFLYILYLISFISLLAYITNSLKIDDSQKI